MQEASCEVELAPTDEQINTFRPRFSAEGAARRHAAARSYLEDL
jgi:hypothetical protein